MERAEPADHQPQRPAGQKIQLAVFGINGPLSNPPTNYIWMREAKLEFYKGGVAPVAITPSEVNVEVVRKDPAIDAIVPPNPKIFKLAEGFKFTEGPVWDRKDNCLLFSDPNNNTIYKYSPDANGQLDCLSRKERIRRRGYRRIRTTGIEWPDL